MVNTGIKMKLIELQQELLYRVLDHLEIRQDKNGA